MATTPIFLTDAYISIDGTVYAGQGINIAIVLNTRTTEVPAAMGEDVDRVFPQARSWSAEVELQSQSANDANVWDLWSNNATVPVEFRPSSDAVGVSNPSYSGTATVVEVTPLSGTQGDLRTVSISLTGASDLVRAIA